MKYALFGALLISGLAGVTQAHAATVTTTNMQGIASSAPFPASTGSHMHGALGSPSEVGSYSSSEEVRGVAEFDLTGLSAGSATLSFSVAEIGSSNYSQTGPGNYTIEIVAYAGNNGISNSDFQEPAVAVLGTFSTPSLVLGQVFSFDVSSAYNSSLASNGGSGSLGIRLQPTSNPGNNVANRFGSFQLQTADKIAVPVPINSNLIEMALLLCAAGGYIIFRKEKREKI